MTAGPPGFAVSDLGAEREPILLCAIADKSPLTCFCELDTSLR
jgi:hypothetical protein